MQHLITNARLAQEEAAEKLRPISTVIQAVYILSAVASEKGEALPVDQGKEAFVEALQRYTDNGDEVVKELKLDDDTMEWLSKSITINVTKNEDDQSVRIALTDEVIEKCETIIRDSFNIVAEDVRGNWCKAVDDMIESLRNTELKLVSKGVDHRDLQKEIQTVNDTTDNTNDKFTRGVLAAHNQRLDALFTLCQRLFLGVDSDRPTETFMELDENGMVTLKCETDVASARDAGVCMCHLNGTNEVTVYALQADPGEGEAPDRSDIRQVLTTERAQLREIRHILMCLNDMAERNIRPLTTANCISSISDLAALVQNWRAVESMFFGIEQELAHYLMSISNGDKAVNRAFETSK